jgi:outer membrane protein assembly factor BamA
MLLLWGLAGGGKSMAQDAVRPAVSLTPAWHLTVDGAATDWTPPAWPLDSLHAMTRRALVHVQQTGYYHARIDSVVTQTERLRPRVEVFVRKGPRVLVDTVRIEGTETVSAAQLRARMRTRPGASLIPARLEADIDAMLAHYEAAGYPLARVRVEETALHPGDPSALQLTLRVDEGPALWLKQIAVPSGARTTPRFVARAAGLEVGTPLDDYDPIVIRQRLQDTGLFRDVGISTLRVEADGGAVLDVPFEERAPGTFDLVVGYLPPAAQQTAGQLVGNGHLRLENVFGGGRTAGLMLDRRPGRVSTADVRLVDPYVFGAPVRLEGRFTGEQRDSTYSKQAYSVAVGLILDAATDLFGTLTRELTQPGPAGVMLEGPRQQIPHSAAWFTGVGVRMRRVDRTVNPRRGFRIETILERGQKTRRFQAQTTDRDTTRQRDAVNQERLQVHGRIFVPTWPGQLMAWGVDGTVMRSDTYDRSDLFRLGGANTLRGYDEDQFLGHIVGRLLFEYRHQIDRESFAYVFGDLGFVATPALSDASAQRQWKPGYGVGIQVSTDLGLIRASYGLNPDDARPLNGRIHLGLSFGL